MKEIRFFYAPDVAAERALPSEEAAHAVRVLRMKEGDALVAADGKGNLYEATIAAASRGACYLDITRCLHVQPTWQSRICLAVAPTKNMDRMEWLAEKATEIGFDELALLDCDNSERRAVKTERLDKIIVSAMKQSRKACKPLLRPMEKFADFVKQPFDGQKFIAHCYAAADIAVNTPHPAAEEAQGSEAAAIVSFDTGHPDLQTLLSATQDSLVLIGPEGDFSIEEVRLALSLGFQSVSLGPSRLRTETAALTAVHLMNLAKRM